MLGYSNFQKNWGQVVNKITTLHLIEEVEYLEMGTMTTFPSIQAKQNYEHPLEIWKLYESYPTYD